MKLIKILFCLLFCYTSLYAQKITILQQDKPTSIRGLSVVDDNIAWISGSKGYIATTTDGGKTWDWQQVKGYEKSDFRDVEAFSVTEAVIMSSGTPAVILKTKDGGKSWQEKYRQTDTTYFLDAMDFDGNKHGYVLGDPINNKFLLLETKDAGETWAEVKNAPDALPGEAAFAASGTCLRVDKGIIKISSGGISTRLITFSPQEDKWIYQNLPIIHATASQGAFSVASSKKTEIIVGGDYDHDKKIDSVVTILNLSKNPQQFIMPAKGPAGFQSCVEYISGNVFLSTGTPGSNITLDNGKTWLKIDSTSYNVCRKAKHGKLVLLAGNGGKIGLFKM